MGNVTSIPDDVKSVYIKERNNIVEKINIFTEYFNNFISNYKIENDNKNKIINDIENGINNIKLTQDEHTSTISTFIQDFDELKILVNDTNDMDNIKGITARINLLESDLKILHDKYDDIINLLKTIIHIKSPQLVKISKK